MSKGSSGASLSIEHQKEAIVLRYAKKETKKKRRKKKDHYGHEDEKPRGPEMSEPTEGMRGKVSNQHVGISRSPIFEQYFFEVILLKKSSIIYIDIPRCAR